MSAPTYLDLLALVRTVAATAPVGGGREGRRQRDVNHGTARRLARQYDDFDQPQLPAVDEAARDAAPADPPLLGSPDGGRPSC